MTVISTAIFRKKDYRCKTSTETKDYATGTRRFR